MSYSNCQYLQELSKNQQHEMMNVDFFDNRELKVNKYDNAYVLPVVQIKDSVGWRVGGVLDDKKNYIEESGQYAYGEKTRVYGKYDFNDDEIDYVDEEVIYLNNYISQWGHYLLDVIGRLWYALDNNIKIIYTGYLNVPTIIEGNFLELLKLLGINEDRLLRINKVTKFKSVIIPDTSICTAKFYTKEYKKLIDVIIDNALKNYELKDNRKVYCSRKHFTHRRTAEFGEENIESIFSINGYEIVYMEELSLTDQIRLLNECKEIVSISGTLVHNAMFIRNNYCNFTILNKTYNINENIYLTNQLSNANFTFVDAYLSPLPISKGKGPYIVKITNEFVNYCKDNNLAVEVKEKTKEMISSYYKNYLRKYYRRIFNNKAKYEKYSFSLKEIRNHYHKQLKNKGI